MQISETQLGRTRGVYSVILTYNSSRCLNLTYPLFATHRSLSVNQICSAIEISQCYFALGKEVNY